MFALQKRFKDVIVLFHSSYWFSFRNLVAYQNYSKKFHTVQNTSSTFFLSIFSFNHSLFSQIRSVLQYFLFATRQNASATRQNAFATRQNAFATRQNAFATRNNAFATRQNVSATRQNVSATRQNASVTRQNATATRNNLSVSVFKTDFRQIMYISHIIPSPIAPSSDLLHIPHNLLPT